MVFARKWIGVECFGVAMAVDWKNALVRLALLFCVVLCGVVLTSCTENNQYTQSSSTEYFVQDYVPETLDILWVVNDRSPMRSIKEKLVDDAREFFKRLDASTTATGNYRMAITSADMQFNKGALKPSGISFHLSKNVGTVESRAALFADLFSQSINLKTGFADRGFEAAFSALNSSFVSRSGVPLVIVFISDSDDVSVASGDAVEFYAQAFLALKGNNSSLLRVYSVNYTSDGERCVELNSTNADIDKEDSPTFTFEDRYFRLANRLAGGTADICESWAPSVNLSGLKLSSLNRRFRLSSPTTQEAISVSVSLRNGGTVEIAWSFDASTNEIVFALAPPEGASIAITYH